MNYGKYFRKEEFVCKHCGEENISQLLVDSLNKLRELTGKPIIINSGYRCPIHNKSVGGTKNSKHVLGLAADIVIKGLSVRKMYEYASKIDAFKNGGIGVYPDNGFIHVDVRGYKARWAKISGKMTSIEKYI